MRKFKCAFTLPEVLITLGIIGIVAAITMPSLITKHQEKVLITQIKKSYSVIENAFKMYQADNGYIGDFTIIENKTNLDANTEFAKYFNGAKLCKNADRHLCKQYNIKAAHKMANNDGTETIDYDNMFHSPYIKLKDGSIIRIDTRTQCKRTVEDYMKNDDGSYKKDNDGNYITYLAQKDNCGFIYVDVNGQKAPNQLGRDVFYVSVASRNFVIPRGYLPGNTLYNILQGKDELDYEDYKVGEQIEK